MEPPRLHVHGSLHHGRQKRRTATRAGRYIAQPSGYRAFVPEPLPPDPPIRFTAEIPGLLSDADRALGRLDGSVLTLPKLTEKQQRKPIYTDFEDVMGAEAGVVLPGFGEGQDFARFRAKAQAYLRAHQDHVAIQKLRTNRPLTATDLSELERVLVESGVGAQADIERAKSESQGLDCLFGRWLEWIARPPSRRWPVS
jgi:hypothetical protein